MNKYQELLFKKMAYSVYLNEDLSGKIDTVSNLEENRSIVPALELAKSNYNTEKRPKKELENLVDTC